MEGQQKINDAGFDLREYYENKASKNEKKSESATI